MSIKERRELTLAVPGPEVLRCEPFVDGLEFRGDPIHEIAGALAGAAAAQRLDLLAEGAQFQGAYLSAARIEGMGGNTRPTGKIGASSPGPVSRTSMIRLPTSRTMVRPFPGSVTPG